MERDVRDAMDCVEQFEMRVEAAEPTAKGDEPWNRRAEVLAAWLLDEWNRESREAA